MFDAVEDISEVGMDGFFILFRDRARGEFGEGGELVDELVGAAVGVVAFDEFCGAGRVFGIGG